MIKLGKEQNLKSIIKQRINKRNVPAAILQLEATLKTSLLHLTPNTSLEFIIFFSMIFCFINVQK